MRRVLREHCVGGDDLARDHDWPAGVSVATFSEGEGTVRISTEHWRELHKGAE